MSATPADVAVPAPHMRRIVLDYLLHRAYVDTAVAFARRSASASADMHVDESSAQTLGISESLYKSTVARRLIIDAVERGDIDAAIALCREHFGFLRGAERASSGSVSAAAMDADDDASMDDESAAGPQVPRHYLSLDERDVYLNLRIQSFVEHVRVAGDALDDALAEFAQLSADVSTLPVPTRNVYTTELERVAGLLAYSDMGASPLRELCGPQRRRALAGQLNSAILAHLGLPTLSVLEMAVRQTSYTWQELHERGIAVPAGHPLYAIARLASACRPSGAGASVTEPEASILPLWSLHDL